MQPANLNLNYMVPTVVTDGNAVLINESGVSTLVFFEARKQTEDGLQADVVASVRVGDIKDLKALQNAIADTIKQHQTREK